MKPFYVRHKNREEAIEIIDLAVANGARLHNGVGGHHDCPFSEVPTLWEYVGVDYRNDTAFSDYDLEFGESAAELTIEQVRETFGEKNKTLQEPEFHLVYRHKDKCPSSQHSSYGDALYEAKKSASRFGGKWYVLSHSATVEPLDIKVTEMKK